MNTLDPKGPAAETLANIGWLMFVLATLVYIAVTGLILFAAFRRRRDGGRFGNFDDNRFIVFGGIAMPGVILAGLAFVTVKSTNDLRQRDDDALAIEVIGHDWWWEVRYTDTEVETANEVRVPAGRPVELTLHSEDVIHSFWVPELAGKVDMIPGQTTRLQFTADEPGIYRGQCAEFCGLQHANMSFFVVALASADFDDWLTTQEQKGSRPTTADNEGQEIFERLSCAGCHTIRGTEAEGTSGPDLTDFGGRRSIGADTVDNTPENLAAWLLDARSLKPGNAMPPVELEPDELDALVDYLMSQE